MNNILTVETERVDDLPLLMVWLKNMRVAEFLDKHFPTHFNWEGLGLGDTVCIWLCHILSRGDHRLNHVQPWAAERLQTLCLLVGQTVRDLDFADDRLAAILDLMSDDTDWMNFEEDIARHSVRVFELPTECVRLDGSTISSFGAVRPDGLFQYGYSKGPRKDLPVLKIMQATLDPLGLPIIMQVLNGKHADDPLYAPAMERVHQIVGKSGLLYVGDCKMASLDVRARAQQAGDYYLCPLPQVQLSSKELEGYLIPVFNGQQVLTPVYWQGQAFPAEALPAEALPAEALPAEALPAEALPGQEAEKKLVARGFELPVTIKATLKNPSPEKAVENSHTIEGKKKARQGKKSAEEENEKTKVVLWLERRIVIQSTQWATSQEKSLRERVARAVQEIQLLNERKQGKKRLRDVEEASEAVEAILRHCRVQGLLQIECLQAQQDKCVRGYKGNPDRVEVISELNIQVSVNEEALEQAIKRLGWRVYVTNAPVTRLGFTEVVKVYRGQYIIERGFGRLKGRPLSICPMYLQKDERATGLVRLLTIGLQVLCLVEHVARRTLANDGKSIAGLYAGNATRSTTRPTTELMLEAFQGVTLSVVRGVHGVFSDITPLKAVQQEVLRLLNLSPSVYDGLPTHFANPP